MPPKAPGAVESPSIAQLYADVPAFTPIQDGDQAYASLMGSSLTASTRGDLAGAAVTLLRSPITYQQKCIRMWEAYTTDPLFMRLVNRVIDFTSHDSDWETRDPDTAEPSWMKRVKAFFSRKEAALDREADIWNAWAAAINQDAPNTPQGLQMIVRWITKHCLLEGMAPMAWEWQPFKFGKQTFLFPMNMTVYPSSAIALHRPSNLFSSETMYLMLPTMGQPLNEGYNPEASFVSPLGASPNMRLLPLIGTQSNVHSGTIESHAIKYGWSPGDLTTTRIGQMVMTGWGQYPMPPFISLLPQFTLRQKLFAADNAIADGVANYMKIFKIGNKDRPLLGEKKVGGVVTEPGDIAAIRAAIEPQLALGGGAMALYLPWFVDLEIKMPDTEMLLSEEKYAASTLEVTQAFGIFTARSPSGRNEKFEKLNLAGFEEMLWTLQWHIQMFFHRLARRVLEVNSPMLKHMPTWTPSPANTKSDEYRTAMLELAKIGRMSSKSVMRAHGLDQDLENRRIAEDLARETDKLYDENVPLTLKQTAEMPEKPPPGGKSAKKPKSKTVSRTNQPPATTTGKP